MKSRKDNQNVATDQFAIECFKLLPSNIKNPIQVPKFSQAETAETGK